MANTALQIAELDFFSIKENLKTYLRSQPEFTDYDFEGSGMSVLLDILAYNTHYMGYYLNMVANEMFLDTAQLRNSVLSHAKLLGYIPGSKKGATAKINIQATPSNNEDNDITAVTLEKYTRLLGEDIDGVNYGFVTVDSTSATKANGSFSFSNVEIKQGEVVTRQFLMDSSINPDRRFPIQSANVDTTSLTISVQQSISNTYTQAYTLNDDLVELTGNSKVFFLEENTDKDYVVYFGDNVIGKQPDDGSVIICTYLDVVGDIANNISNFTFVEPIGGEFSDNVTITAVTSSRAGAEKETITQVKHRAPLYYTAQNRMVTTSDYETLLLKDYPDIRSVNVWGGEDNDPPVYGKVYMSILPRGNYVLTNAEKEAIKEQLIADRNVMTVFPEIVDPEIVYLLVEGEVNYDSTLTTKTASQLSTIVDAAISDYNAENLNTFSAVFRKSKLQNEIESSDNSITGSNIQLYVQKRVPITTGVTKSYDVNFNMELYKSFGASSTKLYTFPQLKVYDNLNVLRDINFEEVPESLTGIRSIEVTNSGRNYTTTPTVTISGDGTGATASAQVIAGKIESITVTNSGSNYTRATVTITSDEGSEATATVRLESDFGKLRTFYYKSNGEKVVVNSNAGTIDYAMGKIRIESLLTTEVIANEFYDDDILTINIIPRNEVIRPVRNRILSFDTANPKTINLDVTAE